MDVNDDIQNAQRIAKLCGLLSDTDVACLFTVPLIAHSKINRPAHSNTKTFKVKGFSMFLNHGIDVKCFQARCQIVIFHGHTIG